MTEGSTCGTLGNVSWVQKAALQLYPGTSLHVISYTRSEGGGYEPSSLAVKIGPMCGLFTKG